MLEEVFVVEQADSDNELLFVLFFGQLWFYCVFSQLYRVMGFVKVLVY